MIKANVIFVGDPEAEDVDSFLPLENIVVIQCQNAEQLKEMIKTGKAEFTVFGADDLSLTEKIEIAQVHAGESAVLANLAKLGL